MRTVKQCRQGRPQGMWWHVRCLVVLGMLSSLWVPSSSRAQTPAVPGRLTVRPREMATGTRTAQAGLQVVDSSPHPIADEGGRHWPRISKLYVPPSCVGTRRCPLVVMLGSALIPQPDGPDRIASLANRYGTIVLAPWSISIIGVSIVRNTSQPFLVRQLPKYSEAAVHYIDTVLQRVLRNYAIDPDKIAIIGSSNDGATALFFGRNNPDVFRRIAVVDPAELWVGAGPRDTTTQVFVSGGLARGAFLASALAAARQDRRLGSRVTQAAALRTHAFDSIEKEFIWRWLAESWVLTPGPATGKAKGPSAGPSSVSIVTADSLPLLTPEAVAQLTTFSTTWRGSLTDPGHATKEVRLSSGHGLFWLSIPDVVAQAATDTTMAAALLEAGLTPGQYERYWLALTSAKLTHVEMTLNDHLRRQDSTLAKAPPPPTSMLGKNAAFLAAHWDAVEALEGTFIWGRPQGRLVWDEPRGQP